MMDPNKQIHKLHKKRGCWEYNL
uniref:Uncharacterized protein n=1 Tax=Rhizophora mucronata TaxID=61149 RepID=A0A2P2IHY4_RHIMU